MRDKRKGMSKKPRQINVLVSYLLEKCYNIRKNIKNKGADKMSERKDFLNGKIQALQDERAAYAGDQAEQIRINGTLATFQKELDDITSNEQAIEQAHVERMADSQAEAGVTLETIEIGGLRFRNLIGSDDDYLTACSMVNQISAVQAEKFSLIIRGYEEREIQLQRQNGELQIENRKLDNLLESYIQKDIAMTTDRGNLILEKEDAEEKRDNAISQLEDAQKEIKRLEAKVDEQRKEMANGVRGEIKVIDIEADKARAEKTRLEKTIYDLVPDRDFNPLNYTATVAFTGERISFSYYIKNSFIILDAEKDGAQIEEFKANQPQNIDVTNLFVETGVTLNSFQGSTEIEADQSVEPTGEPQAIDGSRQAEGNAETQQERRVNSVSREEFDELKADVEALKRGRIAA